MTETTTRQTPDHLGGSYRGGDVHTFTPDVWGYLLVEYDIRSVVDIGCGFGHNAKWFHDQGCEVLGIEGDPVALAGNVLPKDMLVAHDYTKGPYALPKPYDLAIATEFVEHVESQYEHNWLETVKGCQWFLMCHAVPQQGGHHHVNEQYADYWIDKLAAVGYSYFPVISRQFQDTCKRKPAPWGRPTLMFFGRDE